MRMGVGQRHLDVQQVLALFVSGLRPGILGKERFEYWHLPVWTLI
jgi:hypothetical protein